MFYGLVYIRWELMGLYDIKAYSKRFPLLGQSFSRVETVDAK